ncbi:hypothetical protein PARMER_04212 [Parabacteroides merdae ATCC 43184]|nr:hypothetical protein PARMER_04212 [Parabacteroides merdae ATCC 43184]
MCRLCLKVFCQLGFIFDILTKIFFSSGKSSYFILIFVSGIN